MKKAVLFLDTKYNNIQVGIKRDGGGIQMEGHQHCGTYRAEKAISLINALSENYTLAYAVNCKGVSKEDFLRGVKNEK